MPTDPLPALLTVEEVAEYFRVADSTVYRWLRSGSLTAIRVGGTVRVRADDVADLLAAPDHEPAA